MKIPSLSEVNPRILELEKKRDALNAQRSPRVVEAAAVRARIQIAPSIGNASANRVRRMLGETVEPETTPDALRLGELLRELSDLNSAIGQTDAAIRKERENGSRMVCNAMRSDVIKLGKAFGAAFLELHKTHTAYNLAFDAIEDSGASTSSLGRVWPNDLGSPFDSSGQYKYAFGEFVDAGYVNKADVPAPVR